MEGGLLAMVREGDVIKIDIPNRRLDLVVDDGELEKRRKDWKRPQPKVDHGVLGRYARMVSSAAKGAVFE
jgi:dihydroxy-acid dehydratase